VSAEGVDGRGVRVCWLKDPCDGLSWGERIEGKCVGLRITVTIATCQRKIGNVLGVRAKSGTRRMTRGLSVHGCVSEIPTVPHIPTTDEVALTDQRMCLDPIQPLASMTKGVQRTHTSTQTSKRR
jgi:hypothetical protein